MSYSVSFSKTTYFSDLINDYIAQKPELKPFYNLAPTPSNFGLQCQAKLNNYPTHNRSVLVQELTLQYAQSIITQQTLANIELLAQSNTVTLTTGHQLNLFTGPLYFIYKIITVIKLANQLQQQYPKYQFVPVYWMATEDHDFEEINHFNFQNQTFQWHSNQKGAVGEFSTEGLASVYAELETILPQSTRSNYIKNLFKEAYLQHSNLAEATRYLVNKLFGEDGLVIIDGNSKSLKQLTIPYFKDELLNQSVYQHVTATNHQLKPYPIQVNPREINLFYKSKNLRERIVKTKEGFEVINTTKTFTQNQVLDHLQQHPESFSPNVLVRPLYQEVVLPNIAYIGGAGEIAYWLQLQSYFEYSKVTFPILLVRNSVLLLTNKQNEKRERLQLSPSDLFLPLPELISQKISQKSQVSFDFSSQKQTLHNQFEKLYQIALQTDASFGNAVKAQEKKQIKGLEKLEKRLLKAEIKSHQQYVDQITQLIAQLFPNQSLQERTQNLSYLYLQAGKSGLETLYHVIQPLEQDFKVVTI